MKPWRTTFALLCSALAALQPCAARTPPRIEQAVSAPVAEAIGDRIYRFHADPEARKRALPSFTLRAPHPALGPVPAGRGPRPAFSSADGKRVVRLEIEPGTSLYGTGEVAGPLLRNGRRSVGWNTDAFAYGERSPSLYKSFPWVLGLRVDGSAFGVLADTTYRCEIDLRAPGEIVFRADGPAFPVTVIHRPTPQEVVMALADLTGRIPMPPRWALGFHQCRYSYEPEAKVRAIAEGFRSRRIPCDVLWLDIDYMDGYRCFTWDPKRFPDPRRLNADLHGQGFRTVWMIDPGIKAEVGYSVFDQGSARDAWVKRADGRTDYTGNVWPGACVFPDFTRRATRSWWAGLYTDFMAAGADGVWNDMNEPAVFNTADGSKTMPEDNLHRADAEFGGPGPHSRFHNIYGTLMARATREGIAAAHPDRRPFVLSRALHLGGQRYAASWTGDNVADWNHFNWSVPMVLNLGLSGQPFSGPDIGGFVGNGPKGAEGGRLFARWMGVGTLLPFARAHTAKGNIDKEPWSFGPAVEATCRTALERRYRLLPYFYTLFREASTIGMPVARPLWFADPVDPALRDEDGAFLLGDALLVVLPAGPERPRPAALPRGPWRKLDLDEGFRSEDLPELYIKAGTILPVGPKLQFTGEAPLDPLTLHVALDGGGRARGVLYEDAGDGHGHLLGDYRLTFFEATRIGAEVRVKAVKHEGKWTNPPRSIKVIVHEP